MNLDWFTGFVEGEGCFSISFGIKASNVYPRASFTIGVTDKEVLLKIKDYLFQQGIDAKIYQKPSKRRHNFANEPKAVLDIWDLKVCNLGEVNKLTEFLDQCEWYSKKAWTFKRWKIGLGLISKRHSTRNYIKIAAVAQQLNDSGQGRRKWTPNYILSHCYDKNGVVKFRS